MSNRLQEICDTFESELAKFEEQKKAMVEKLRPTFTELFKEFFDRHPLVQYITWTQFTPYFCDGEPCEFGVNELHGYLTREDMEDDPWDGTFPIGSWRWDRSRGPELDKNILEAFGNDLAKIKQTSEDFDLLQVQISSIDDSLMEDVFGDHVRVIVSKDGLYVDEYEHD